MEPPCFGWTDMMPETGHCGFFLKELCFVVHKFESGSIFFIVEFIRLICAQKNIYKWVLCINFMYICIVYLKYCLYETVCVCFFVLIGCVPIFCYLFELRLSIV